MAVTLKKEDSEYAEAVYRGVAYQIEFPATKGPRRFCVRLAGFIDLGHLQAHRLRILKTFELDCIREKTGWQLTLSALLRKEFW